MKLARIANGRVAEVFEAVVDGIPMEERFPAEFIAGLRQVPPEIADQVQVGWDVNEAGSLVQPVAQVAVVSRKLWPLSFRYRLGMEKRAALTLAASQAMEAGDPSLQVFFDDLSASRVVDLDNPEVTAAVALLVKHGLLTPEERDALLADPTPEEMEGLS